MCALMRARAGTVHLPYGRHVAEVTFLAWRHSSMRRLTFCNATRELFGCGLRAWVVSVLSVGFGLEEGGMQGQEQGAVLFGFAMMRACRNGSSPMDMAQAMGHSDCVAALVRAGAPPPE
jgi:hypothetical protein